MKFTELPNVGITNTWRENIFSYLKETRSLSLNFIFLNKTFTMLNNRGKCIVYSGKSAPKLCFKTPTECVKPAKCFIAHKLSGWFYHTDGKRCAFFLTSSNEAVGRGTNDFIRIGTFEIISSHCYLFLWRFLGKVSRQMQLTMRNKFQETVYDEKKIIFAAPLIYLNYTIDDSLKTVMLKNI